MNNTSVEGGGFVELNVTLNATDTRYEGPGLNVSVPQNWDVVPVNNDSGAYKRDGDTAKCVWENRGEKNVSALVRPPSSESSGNYTVTVEGSAVNTTPSDFRRETDTDTVGVEVISVCGNLNPVGTSPDPPQDLNGDGLCEDVDGSSSFNLLDVSVFYSEYQSDPVLQNNPGKFDFNGDSMRPNLLDVSALYQNI